MRVIELARSLGLDSADLISLLEELGISVRSDASILEERHIRVVRASTAALEAARARRAARELASAHTGIDDTELKAETATDTRDDTSTDTSWSASPETSADADTSSASPLHETSQAQMHSAAHSPSHASQQAYAAREAIEDEWSIALSGSRRPVLLWGPPGSGKSTFLAGMMFRQVEDDADPYDWRIMSVGPRAGDYIRSVLQAYRSGGQPNATLVTDAPFRFKVRKVRKERRFLGALRLRERTRLEADLLLVDPPGELFTISKMRGRNGGRVLQLMQNAAGLLLLIDPTFTEGDDPTAPPALGDVQRRIDRQRRYWTMLVENISEIIHHLRSQTPEVQAATLDHENRLRIPTAICVTKMDRHPREAHRPTEFLREQIGEAAFRVIDTSFANYTVYACSALGNEVRAHEKGVILNGEPKPWGVIDPIRWILEESMQKRRSQLLARFGW